MKVIYLDHCATTPCHEEVIQLMSKYHSLEFGNPSSQHILGKRALHAINQATKQVAELIHAEPEEIIFTSGATESNNLFLLGLYEWLKETSGNIILSPIDHKSTLEVGNELARRGIEVRYAKVNHQGRIHIPDLERMIDHNTKLISCAHINSELGVIQDIEALSILCSNRGILLHVDAVQSIGKIDINCRAMNIASLSLSGHKIYGPKGIGALYVNKKIRHIVRPLTFGGGQNSLRSGTLPTAQIVGLGHACYLAQENINEHYAKVQELRDLFLQEMRMKVPAIQVNNDPAVSVPHILNLRINGVSSEALVSGLGRLAIASGSACNSASLEPSYVLTTIGLTGEEANHSIRICFSPYQEKSDIIVGVELLSAKINNILELQGEFI